jgi:nitrate reductase NapAB chaperone NapD
MNPDDPDRMKGLPTTYLPGHSATKFETIQAQRIQVQDEIATNLRATNTEVKNLKTENLTIQNNLKLLGSIEFGNVAKVDGSTIVVIESTLRVLVDAVNAMDTRLSKVEEVLNASLSFLRVISNGSEIYST